jgi:hypothetical protein
MSPPGKKFDLIAALVLSGCPIIVTTLGEFLDPDDIVALYSVSRDFHAAVNTLLTSCFKAWTGTTVDGSLPVDRLAPYGYKELLIPDPARRFANEFDPEAPKDTVRLVPSLRLFRMVADRFRKVREILAHLARAGFRTPLGTDTTLLKVWMLMDVPTTRDRALLMSSRQNFMTDSDLVNGHIFFAKLMLHLTSPCYGPNSCELLSLFFSQRGLNPLWQMLMGHKYRTTAELLHLVVRTRFVPPDQYKGQPILGIPAAQIGTGHREHWGTGTGTVTGTATGNLARPLDLFAHQLIRRDLRLNPHIYHFMLWGHIDHATGRNLAPTEDEIYMRDADYANQSIDISCEFQPFHCRKARWNTLSTRERNEALRAEERLEAYICSFDKASLDDFSTADAASEDMGNDIYPPVKDSSDNDDEDGTQNPRPKKRVVIGSWEAGIVAQLRRIESGVRTIYAVPKTWRDDQSEAVEMDPLMTAISYLTRPSECVPRISRPDAKEKKKTKKPPPRPGRYRFLPVCNSDDPYRATPFANVGPAVEEPSTERQRWNQSLSFFQRYFTT